VSKDGLAPILFPLILSFLGETKMYYHLVLYYGLFSLVLTLFLNIS